MGGREWRIFFFSVFFSILLSLSSYFSFSHLLILIDERDLVALFRGKKKRCNDKFRFPSSSHSFPSNVISLIPLTVNLFLLQYGSDEFGQDSPRYTSPKAAALYADPYYIGKSRFHTLRKCNLHFIVGDVTTIATTYEGNRVIIIERQRE